MTDIAELTPDILKLLDNEALRKIAIGTHELVMLHYSPVGRDKLREQRERHRLQGLNTVRLDAELEIAERLLAGPTYYLTEVKKAA